MSRPRTVLEGVDFNDLDRVIAELHQRAEAAESLVRQYELTLDPLETYQAQRIERLETAARGLQQCSEDWRGRYETAHASRLHAEQCLERAEQRIQQLAAALSRAAPHVPILRGTQELREHIAILLTEQG